MNRLQLITGTALIGFSALTAQAAPGPADEMRKMRDPFPIDLAAAEARRAEHFARLDADGDGRVTAEEFAASRWHPRGGPGMHGKHGDRKFGAHGERRGDGNRHERRRERAEGTDPAADTAARAARREAMAARRAEHDGKLFAKLDTDGDGKLSASEFDTRKLRDAQRSIARSAMFERLDANGDGALTQDELPDPVGRLRALDADGDGQVTREEARAMRRGKPANGG